MTAQEIISSSLSKTDKIKGLLGLGWTRVDIANALGINYGFVQNVFARVYPDRIRSRRTLAEVVNEAEWNLSGFVFNHTFGVEIEAFGITRQELQEELTNAGLMSQSEDYNHHDREHWKITTDSSIRGEYAFELVSPKLRGEQGLRQLKTALLILRGLGAKVNKTCGLHIHLNASEFTAQTWKNLFKNYAVLEPLIDGFMPESRRGNVNNYCRSLRVERIFNQIDSIPVLEDAAETVRRLDSLVTGRYFKLNVLSFWCHRSVEFRQHSGTTDFTKIKNWILFVSRLVEFSKQAVVSGDNLDQLSRFLPDELKNYFAQRTAELS